MCVLGESLDLVHFTENLISTPRQRTSERASGKPCIERPLQQTNQHIQLRADCMDNTKQSSGAGTIQTAGSAASGSITNKTMNTTTITQPSAQTSRSLNSTGAYSFYRSGGRITPAKPIDPAAPRGTDTPARANTINNTINNNNTNTGPRPASHNGTYPSPSIPVAAPTGKWEHPSLQEIRQRSVSKEVVLSKVLNNSIILATIMFAVKVAGTLIAVKELVAKYPSAMMYAKMAFMGLTCLCLFNIVGGLRILVTPRDPLDAVPMTAAQRKLLNLPNSARTYYHAKPASHTHEPGSSARIYTPPRYPRSAFLSSRSGERSQSPGAAWRDRSGSGSGTGLASSPLGTRYRSASAGSRDKNVSFLSNLSLPSKSADNTEPSKAFSPSGPATTNSSTAATLTTCAETVSPASFLNNTTMAPRTSVLASTSTSPFARSPLSKVSNYNSKPRDQSLGTKVLGTTTPATPVAPFAPSAKFLYMSESTSSEYK